MTANNVNPKLRNVGFQNIVHNGQSILLLRDPLRLSDQAVVLPQQLAFLVPLLDGTRAPSEIRAALAVRTGIVLPNGFLERVIEQLDDAYLLDNERFAQAHQRALEAYRSAPHRAPSSAGYGYPADPKALCQLLDSYLDGLREPLEEVAGARGVLSPHIDYQRGGRAYARTWASAAQAVLETELVVIFATDHAAPTSRLTLTRQHYATPYGVLPTDREIIDGLAANLGEEEAFADELHHVGEHAIELPLTWLHHMRGGEPCRVAPILCGSFQRFMEGAANPWDDPTLNTVIDYLRPIVNAPKTLVMASGDLAHLGPAFGGAPLSFVERAQIQVDDSRLIQTLVEGNAEGFFCAIKAEKDRRNVCGTAPFYMALRTLSPARGVRVAYDRCPADDRNTSVVSIAGVVMM